LHSYAWVRFHMVMNIQRQHKIGRTGINEERDKPSNRDIKKLALHMINTVRMTRETSSSQREIKDLIREEEYWQSRLRLIEKREIRYIDKEKRKQFLDTVYDVGVFGKYHRMTDHLCSLFEKYPEIRVPITIFTIMRLLHFAIETYDRWPVFGISYCISPHLLRTCRYDAMLRTINVVDDYDLDEKDTQRNIHQL
jgi:hypothetical protein